MTTALINKSFTSPQLPGWKWNVIEHEFDEVYFCKVQSPIVPEGEFGSVDFSELNEQVTLLSV